MFKKTKLKNGIEVLLAKREQTKAVSVLVLTRVGSRYETPKNNGISHFLEHLMFKGTQKRPTTLEISQELDSIGADYNAFTSKEITGYYIKAEKTSLYSCVDILSDMLLNSVFDKDEVGRERGTILEEINMYEDNPMSKIGDFFEEDLFGKNEPLGMHVIGTPGNIKSITRDDMVSYWKKHYHAGNFLISVAGNFDEKEALEILNEKFGAVSKGARNKISQGKSPSKSFKACAHFKKTSQAHLILGFPSFSENDPQRYALSVLNVILGGNMSSRLFIEVRERLGLCYFIRSSAEYFDDTGVFYIQAGLDLKKIDKALEVVSKELSDIKNNSVSQKELTKAKKFVKGKIALSHEDSLEIASFYGQQAISGKKILTPEEVLKKIEKVSLADVKKVAKRVIQKNSARLVAISPNKDISKFAKNLNF